MPPGAGGRAGILRVATELVVDGLPRLLRHAALVAAGLFHLLVEEVQVDCGQRVNITFNNMPLTLFKIFTPACTIFRPYDWIVILMGCTSYLSGVLLPPP